MPRFPLKNVIAALILITSIVLAGCGNGSGTSGTKALTIFTSPKGNFTNNFNPFAAGNNDGSFGEIYEPLLAIQRMNGTVNPWLASDYKFSTDGKTLTFHLRTDVKWTDGQAFTADDVVYTFNMMKQYPAADTNGIWKITDSVTNPDSSTVVLNLKQSGVTYLWYIGGQTPIVPKHIFSTFSDPTKVTNSNPVGTGPYILDSFKPEVYTLKANPNYWQPVPIKNIRYPALNSNTSAALVLQRGDLDWAGVFSTTIKAYTQANSNNHYWWPSTNIIMLYLNLTKAPFNDLAFRQAVSKGLDRTALINQAELGQDLVASPTGLVLPNNKDYLDPQYGNTQFGEKDIAGAQKLLDDAGYKKVNGKYTNKDGSPIKFDIDVVDGWTDWVTATQIMAQNLTDLGFSVESKTMQLTAYQNDIQNGTFNAAISWTNTGPTPYYLYNFLLSSSGAAAVGQTATSDWMRFGSKDADTLVNQMATSTDPAAQKQAAYGLEKIMVEQLPAIGLFQGAGFYEYSTARFTGWPDANNAYENPSPFNHPDDARVLLKLSPKS
jgi:peptide/nickel transport system substrate-binding protein